MRLKTALSGVLNSNAKFKPKKEARIGLNPQKILKTNEKM
jgi:hypothetical protein